MADDTSPSTPASDTAGGTAGDGDSGGAGDVDPAVRLERLRLETEREQAKAAQKRAEAEAERARAEREKARLRRYDILLKVVGGLAAVAELAFGWVRRVFAAVLP